MTIFRRMLSIRGMLVTTLVGLLLLWDLSAHYEIGYVGHRWRVSARWGRVVLAWGPISANGTSVQKLQVVPLHHAFGLTLPVYEESSYGIRIVGLPLWIPSCLVASGVAFGAWRRLRPRRVSEHWALRTRLVVAAILFGVSVCTWRISVAATWFYSYSTRYMSGYMIGAASGSVGFEKSNGPPYMVGGSGLWPLGQWPTVYVPQVSTAIVGPHGEPLRWGFFVPSYMLVIVAGLILAWHVVLWRRRVTSELCCPCGYNLRGNVSGTCPECGRKLTDVQRPTRFDLRSVHALVVGASILLYVVAGAVCSTAPLSTAPSPATHAPIASSSASPGSSSMDDSGSIREIMWIAEMQDIDEAATSLSAPLSEDELREFDAAWERVRTHVEAAVSPERLASLSRWAVKETAAVRSQSGWTRCLKLKPIGAVRGSSLILFGVAAEASNVVLPTHSPIVKRRLVVQVVFDPASHRIDRVYVTIRGWTEE